MTLMKKIAFILATVVASVAVATPTVNAAPVAQEQKKEATPESRAEQFAGKLMKELGLTAEQKQREYDAKLAELKGREELNAKYKTGEEQKAHRAEYVALNDTFKAKMKTILTAEQYAQWEKNKAAKKERIEKKG